MPEVIERLRALVVARKTIPAVPSWRERASRDGTVLRLTCPLAVDHVVVEGLTLEGVAPYHLPDRDLVLQLVCVWPASTRRFHLIRVEWRPQKIHRNQGHGPSHLRFAAIPGTQVHPFDLNARLGLEALSPSANLPVAEPINPEPGSVWDFLDLAGALLNIEALAQIGEPPWAPRLDLTR